MADEPQSSPEVPADPSAEQAQEDTERSPCGIVGIGASAGGVEAVIAFLGALPQDTGLAFVVILHLLPDHESHLAEVFQPSTSMPVTEACESEHIVPDHVYIIPPGKDMELVGEELRLSDLDVERHPHTPIDRFFRTLAKVANADATGIVLSGTGSDGSLGVKAIKERGGLVMVQDPGEAAYDAMPRSALATGIVDVVKPTTGLATALQVYRERADATTIVVEPEQLPEDDAAVLRDILTRLRIKTGHDFRHYKRSTVLRRIARRMHIQGITTFTEYREVMGQDLGEPEALMRDLLITVTSFFRDAEAFNTLEQEVIPALFAGKTEQDVIRVWVTGCATGEEAYSIAILMVEHALSLENPPRLQVFASDVSKEAVATARQGQYRENIKEDVSPERIDRFFTREPTGYRVKTALRDVVLFAVHDLLATPPFTRLDLISCRNLLIYLQRDMQERVFDLFHFALRPEGFLFLSTAESPVGPPDQFRPVHPDEHIYKRGTISPSPPHMPELPLGGPLETLSAIAVDRPRATGLTPGKLHQNLVELYAPPSVLINQAYDVVHLSEHVGQYLRPPGGAPTKNILDMVSEPIQLELRTILYKVFRHDSSNETKLVRLEDEKPVRHLRLTVRSTHALDSPQRYALVLFEQVEPGKPRQAEQEPPTGWSMEAAEMIRQLEGDLKITEEQLRTTVEQYETSNEELKSSNEELQSINEELKSTTEELQTSKEELQSTNEELLAVNEEYRAKIEELARANSDLRNLMDATLIGTLFLDKQLRLQRYTQPVENIFNITNTDVGRPLAHFTHHLKYEDLLQDARRVLKDLTVVDREVQIQDGSEDWFIMRMLPYLTAEDEIDGVVITFVNITKQKRAEGRLEESQQRLEAIVQNAQDVILLADDEAQYVDCNPAVTEVLGYTREELMQMGVQDLVVGAAAADFEAVWTSFLEQDATEGEIVVRSKEGHPVEMEYRAVSHILPGLHLSILRNVSDRKQKERMLVRQSQIIDEIHDAVVTTDMGGVIVSANKGVEHLVGYSPEEVVGNHVSMVYPEEEREYLQDQVIVPLKEQGAHEAEVRISHKSGEIVHAHLSLTLLHDEDGHPTGMVGYAVDITERKEAEQALTAANRRIERILESITEGFFVVDEAERLTYVNERAKELWQMEHEDLIGRSIWEILPETRKHPFRSGYYTAVQADEPASVESYYPPLKAWFVVDFYPFEEGVSVFFRDVTEQKRLEQEIVRIQEEAQRRIGRDLHDGLASLLTGLAMLGRGIANRIERDEPVELDTVEELIRQARAGSEQARSLALGLNPVKLEEQGLEAALLELCTTVEVLSNITCSCVIGDTVPSLNGDEYHVYRIAQEATLNAVRHAQASHIELRLGVEDDALVLTVTDDGVGIDDVPHQNGGMGLKTMQYRADLMGARFSINKLPEVGTIVECYIPLSP